MIKSIDIEYIRLPLKESYNLSFASLHFFETVLAHIRLEDGTFSTGEVVPLPGYTDEKLTDVLNFAKLWVDDLIGKGVQEARTRLTEKIQTSPCTSSLFLTGLDGFSFPLTVSTKIKVPLIFPVSSNFDQLAKKIDHGIEEGYRTIKIKIGKDIQKDLAAVELLSSIVSPNILIRFDANQGYTLKEAQLFLSAAEEHLLNVIELVEQPLSKNAWGNMKILSKVTSLPLMLDECIYTNEDIYRAREAGCKWIKLKLCKQGGLNELIEAARFAKSLDLKVVIGNGVATDITNLLELYVYSNFQDLFSGASESNGFLKLQNNIRYPSLKYDDGYAVMN